MLYLLACTGVHKDNPNVPSADSADTATSHSISAGMLATGTIWQSEERAYATGAAFADMDNDGDLDLVVAEGNDMQPGYIRIYMNQQGVLETQASWVSSEPFYYGHLSLGDIDGDGWVDVAVSRYIGNQGFSEPGGVQVFQNRQGELQLLWEADGFYSFSCALGDLDNDGDLDLAVAVGEAYYNDPDSSLVFANDGSGDFSLLWAAAEKTHTYDIAWADINHDGFLDLLLANDTEPHRIYVNAAGRLSEQASQELEGGDPSGNTLDWGDVNQDGYVDLLISENNQGSGAGVVRLWCGPDFELCWESQDPPDMQSAVSLFDVDADGDLDVVAGSWWGTVRIYRNDTGIPEREPSWYSDNQDMVVEAFAWADLDASDQQVMIYEGAGLQELPKGAWVRSIQCGVAGMDYITGSDCLYAEVVHSAGADLLVTDWDPEQGNVLFPFIANNLD